MTIEDQAYWQQREDRFTELKSTPSPRTSDTILRDIDNLDRTAIREGRQDEVARLEALRAELDDVRSEAAAAHDRLMADWPRDVTIARRAAINARIKSGELRNPVAIAQACRDAGFEACDLRSAIEAHAL